MAYFTHDEAFPLIARLISTRHGETHEFVPHDDIVAGLLSDPEAAALLDRAMARGPKQTRPMLASTMVAWFSQQITVGRSEWAPYFDRQKVRARYAYRPVTSVDAPMGADVDIEAVEGEPRLVSHLRRERDRGLAVAKKERALAKDARLVCEACGFDFRARYPGVGIDFCEIHHNRPLGESVGPQVTRLEDLALLCANCHRMIHRVKPLPSVSHFRKYLDRAI